MSKIYTKDAQGLVQKLDAFVEALGGFKEFHARVELKTGVLLHSITQDELPGIGVVESHNSTEIVTIKHLPPGEALLELDEKRKW